jgi:hypothetical protein
MENNELMETDQVPYNDKRDTYKMEYYLIIMKNEIMFSTGKMMTLDILM